MTWSARILKPDGTVDGNNYGACQTCKHGKPDFTTGDPNWPKITPCNVMKAANTVISVLTSIDIGANGHMASGQADLKCNGFEPIPEVDEPDH